MSPADEIGGRYCENCHIAETSAGAEVHRGMRPYVVDPERAKPLWSMSERLVGERYSIGRSSGVPAISYDERRNGCADTGMTGDLSSMTSDATAEHHPTCQGKTVAKTIRLFELMSVLRARRTPVIADDLARELGVSRRTLYRDIETLRALGAPLDGQSGVGYRLRDGFFLPHLAFSPDELGALTLGLDWVRQRADPALARGSESASAKIRSAKTDHAGSTDDHPYLVAAAASRERVDPPESSLLRDAIRRQSKVAISYEDARGTLSDRTIWPIAVVYFDDVRVLAAWCENRSAFRHFRLDRLRVTALLEERYPGRRQALMVQWRQQDRDWRSMLTLSDKPLK